MIINLREFYHRYLKLIEALSRHQSVNFEPVQQGHMCQSIRLLNHSATKQGFLKIVFSEKLQVHQMNLNATRPQVPYVYCVTTGKSQIALRFFLRSLVFQIIEVFGFSIGYNAEFDIFEKRR